MNITCKLGRSFSSIEAVNECSDHHGGCAKHVHIESSSALETTVYKPDTCHQPVMFDCPICVQKGIKGSVWYNDMNQTYECLRCKRDCKTLKDFETKVEIIGLTWNNAVGIEQTADIPELTNPLLLSVKMFLAEIRVWRNKYREDEYVCSDFSQEIVDGATERGMRCGFVSISFERNPVGHAIVAFETDHGLIYIEPQSGEQVDVRLGRPYHTGAKGFEENNIITSIVIRWNDGTTLKL